MKSRLLNQSNGLRIFAVVFDPDDEVVEGLTSFAKSEKISGAQIVAIGALRELTCGYFDWEKKDYRHIQVREQVEVLSLAGNFGLKDGHPKLHAHIVVGRSDGTTRGGHLIKGYVRPTLEVVVTETPEYLRRRMDDETGLALIDLDA